MSAVMTEPKIRTADPWAAHNASSHEPRPWLQKVIEDAEKGIGLSRTYATAAEAVEAMLAEADELDDDDIYADDYYDRLDAQLCTQ